MSAGAIDEAFLDELLDGDREFAEELFATFSDSSASCLEEGGASLSSGDQETSFRLFHTLKGAAASVGLLDVRDVAKEIEHLARSGDLEGCSQRLDALRKAIGQGETLLAGYLERLP